MRRTVCYCQALGMGSTKFDEAWQVPMLDRHCALRCKKVLIDILSHLGAIAISSQTLTVTNGSPCILSSQEI